MTDDLTKSPSRRGICRYCLVETGAEGNHSSEHECVEALAAEVEKARRLLVSRTSQTGQGCLTMGINERHRTAG